MPGTEKSAASVDFVYFDLGNVLLNFSHQLACEQVSVVAQVSVDNIWRTVFETSLVVQYELGQISDEQFHTGFCDATASKVEIAPFLLAFSDIFSLNEPVLTIAGELRRQGIPIGILSNTCTAHWNFAMDRFPELSHCFPTHRILSFEENSAKPDRGIYRAAIERAGVDAHRIFFVDDRADNIAGALAAGLDAVVFESATQLQRELNHRGFLIR